MMMMMMDNYDADKERENLKAAMTPDPLTPSPDSPTPRLESLTGAWDARCTVCGKIYPQHCGSTPCCGALAEVINHRPSPYLDEPFAMPRTQAERCADNDGACYKTPVGPYVPFKFADALERENAALVKEREADQLHIGAQVACIKGLENECDSLRAQLAERDIIIGNQVTRILALQSESAETQEKLKEARESAEDDFIDQLFSHLERFGIDASNWDGDDDPAEIIARNIADLSQPDLPLIEEVREICAEMDKRIAEFFWSSDGGTNMRNGNPEDLEDEGSLARAWSELRRLLTRLNPRK